MPSPLKSKPLTNHSESQHRRSHSRSRSRSPHHRRRHHHHHHHHRHLQPAHTTRHRSALRASPVSLPFNAARLHHRDFRRWRPIFSRYLDIQKQLALEDLSDAEARGRWKSFVGKWNRGELAQGWYEPEMLVRELKAASEARPDAMPRQSVRAAPATASSSDSEGPGPALPRLLAARSGPTIPTLEDLAFRNELVNSDAQAATELHHEERRRARVAAAAQLEDLAPRAEAGTWQRRLEKRKDAAAGAAQVGRAVKGDGVEEVREDILMGDGDGIEGFKKMAEREERRRTEREVRREEIARAKAEEREARVRAWKEKEGRVMEGLVELARKRFG